MVTSPITDDRMSTKRYTVRPSTSVPPEVQSTSSSTCRGASPPEVRPAVSSPLEVTTSVPLGVEPSSNYLSLKSNPTPGDRGEGSDGSSIMGMMEDGSKDVLNVTSNALPVADLREAEGEVNRRAVCKTTSGGMRSGIGRNLTSVETPNGNISGLYNVDDLSFMKSDRILEHRSRLRKKSRSVEGARKHRRRYMEILQRRASKKKCNDNIIYKLSTICKYYYRNGNCIHGDDCKYSHDCIPLTSKDLKLCQFYIKIPSECKFTAEECKYSHDPKLFLCRLNVLNGTCPIGDKCIFDHKTIDEINLMDDTEKLKFCYNNKKFLTKLLIDYLITNSFIDKSSIDINDYDNSSIELIKNALIKLNYNDINKMKWYLKYILMIIEKDLETLN